jgi:hypothetical protein
MTTDNSPQLGGQSEDNSPMIGSVRTRAIVSARGAYLARNLDALVQNFDEDQRSQLFHVMLDQARRCVEAIIPLRPDEDISRAWFDVITGWVDDPQLARKRAHATMHYTPPFDVPPDDYVIHHALRRLAYLASFVGEVMERPDRIAIVFEMLPGVIGVCARAFNDTPYDSYSESVTDANPTHIAAATRSREWMIEAAWAILSDKPVPPLELTP